MIAQITNFANKFQELSDKKEIIVISHFDTEGITSAAIFGKLLKKLDKKFSFRIVKSLEPELIQSLPEGRVIVFLDLASGSLEYISKLSNLVFIIDHHEISYKETLPENVNILNPHLYPDGEEMSGSCLTYLVSREIGKKDSSAANLAIIGMVGDIMEKKIGPLVNTILKDADLTIKRGFLI